jgi:hypothetical protein
LRRKIPEIQDLLHPERKSVLRRHLPKAHDAGSAHPCDGRAKTLEAVGKRNKSAENETNNSARLGFIHCA